VTIVNFPANAPLATPVEPKVEDLPPAIRPSIPATVAVLLAWAGVVALGRWWGLRLLAQGHDIVLPTPPVLGQPGPGWTPLLVIPMVVATVLIGLAPWAAQRLSWRRLLAAVAVGAVIWAVGVALVEGTDGLTRGPSWSTEYGHDVPSVAAAPARFLRTFTDDIGSYEIHVRGHPPGMVLALAGLDRIGLGGPGWEAALVIAAAASAAVAALIAAREVAGEETARRAAPFLVLAPAAIWIASSADALYLGVSAWAITLVVLAQRRSGRRATTLALAGGVLFGLALMGSYGLVLAGMIPLVTAIAWRRWGALLLAAAGAAAVLALFAALGFWWVAGLLATHHEYQTLPLQRPYDYFVINNLSAWALALGPAVAVGLARLRDRRLWLLVAGGLACALAADLSGLSEGEVERIWLPFGLWVLLAGAALVGSTDRRPRWRPAQGWMALQALSTVVLVALVTTQW